MLNCAPATSIAESLTTTFIVTFSPGLALTVGITHEAEPVAGVTFLVVVAAAVVAEVAFAVVADVAFSVVADVAFSVVADVCCAVVASGATTVITPFLDDVLY